MISIEEVDVEGSVDPSSNIIFSWRESMNNDWPTLPQGWYSFLKVSSVNFGLTLTQA
jgi:hypothetical protein